MKADDKALMGKDIIDVDRLPGPVLTDVDSQPGPSRSSAEGRKRRDKGGGHYTYTILYCIVSYYIALHYTI